MIRATRGSESEGDTNEMISPLMTVPGNSRLKLYTVKLNVVYNWMDSEE